MPLQCQICGNASGNCLHRAREMMLGLRDEFEYVECAACGTLQIKAIPDLSRYYPRDYYSFSESVEPNLPTNWKRRLAARYAAAYLVSGRGFVGKKIEEKRDWIKREFPAFLQRVNLNFNHRSRILDFGCGTGKLLNRLRYFGFSNLIGADAFIETDIFYPNGVKIYKRPLEQLEPFFDFIMLHHSFEHLPHPLDALREIHRLLRADRFCLIRLPVASFAWEKYNINWVQLDPPRHLFLFTERSLRLTAEKAGFVVERVIYDSESFQFWASEQYARDISMDDPRSYRGDIAASIFTAEQLEDWEKQTRILNAAGRGDQVCFYLRKP
jgi:SAM-dependent methyltransferase